MSNGGHHFAHPPCSARASLTSLRPAEPVEAGIGAGGELNDQVISLSSWHIGIVAPARTCCELIGELQTTLQLAGVSFTIAPETRRKLEDELVGEGLAAFRKRAESIRASLGGSGYKIVHVGINSGGYRPPQPILDGMVAMRAMAAPAPEFSGGDSDLTMQISGTIEIILPQAKASGGQSND